jgi:signal transduction histidine kinase
MTLRQRLLLPLVPSLLLLAILGGAGIVLLDRVSKGVDLILRENYASVVAMVGLNEALERIDSSFTLAILGDDKARDAYLRNWKEYEHHLKVEEANITILPREQELVDELKKLTEGYRRAGDRFFSGKLTDKEREKAYKGEKGRPGLFGRFNEIKRVSEEIRVLNQDNMVEASVKAEQTARNATVGFSVGLVVVMVLAGLLVWYTVRSILQPIQDVTRSAQAIGAGDLEQVVPVSARDELGELAETFNRMARQLRDYRRTHLDRLLRAQRTSQATIDSFPDPILVIDPDGRVEMANPAARVLFGISPPPPAGVQAAPSPPPPLVWQPPEALIEPLRAALQDLRPFLTQAFDQTVTFRLAGEERAYLPQILPIRDPYGGSLGAAVVLGDVTRFRLLDQIKSDLVATVSHELKTPLTSVRLVLHLLLEETVGPLTAKQTELLVDARDNAERLLNMIEQLLALARLEQARDVMQVQPEAPGDVLRAAAEVARPRAEDRHLTLKVEAEDELPPILVDPARLGKALGNLLDNALTWTPLGGQVTLSADRISPHQVRLSIRDTGPGIPAEYLPHVFERFFRVPGQSTPQGTGLGLAIVREIVAAQGGSVACESPPGQGAAFHLLLPVASGKG